MCSCTLWDFYDLFEKVLNLTEGDWNLNQIEIANAWSKAVKEEAIMFENNADELIAELEKIEYDRWTGKITKSN